MLSSSAISSSSYSSLVDLETQQSTMEMGAIISRRRSSSGDATITNRTGRSSRSSRTSSITSTTTTSSLRRYATQVNTRNTGWNTTKGKEGGNNNEHESMATRALSLQLPNNDVTHLSSSLSSSTASPQPSPLPMTSNVWNGIDSNNINNNSINTGNNNNSSSNSSSNQNKNNDGYDGDRSSMGSSGSGGRVNNVNTDVNRRRSSSLLLRKSIAQSRMGGGSMMIGTDTDNRRSTGQHKRGNSIVSMTSSNFDTWMNEEDEEKEEGTATRKKNGDPLGIEGDHDTNDRSGGDSDASSASSIGGNETITASATTITTNTTTTRPIALQTEEEERKRKNSIVILDVRFILSVTEEACFTYRTTSNGKPEDLYELMEHNSKVAYAAKDKRCGALWKLLATGSRTSILDLHGLLENSDGGVEAGKRVRNVRGHAVTWYTHPIGGKLYRRVWEVILEEGHVQMAAVLSCVVSTFWDSDKRVYRRFAYGYDMFEKNAQNLKNAKNTKNQTTEMGSSPARRVLKLDTVPMSMKERVLSRLHALILNYGNVGDTNHHHDDDHETSGIPTFTQLQECLVDEFGFDP